MMTAADADSVQRTRTTRTASSVMKQSQRTVKSVIKMNHILIQMSLPKKNATMVSMLYALTYTPFP